MTRALDVGWDIQANAATGVYLRGTRIASRKVALETPAVAFLRLTQILLFHRLY